MEALDEFSVLSKQPLFFLESLPSELILIIGDYCHLKLRIDATHIGQPWTFDSAQAALARVSKRFHAILNGKIYRENASPGDLRECCGFWAAQNGRLDTLKLAYQAGADLSHHGLRGVATKIPENGQETYDELDYLSSSLGKPFGPPLHFAIKAGQFKAVEWLLQNGADPQVPFGWVSGRNTIKFVGYPLREASHRRAKSTEKCLQKCIHGLIAHGAWLLANEQPAIFLLSSQGRQEAVLMLLHQRGRQRPQLH